MKIEYIFIHNTAVSLTQPDQWDSVNKYHKEQFNMKSSLGYWVGYNYLMDAFGNIRQARKDGEETAAVMGHNNDSLHICLAGNFDLEQPTINQRHALRTWIKEKMIEHSIPPDKVKGHRWADSAKAQGKTCPGKNLTDKEIFEMADWKKQEEEARLAEIRRKETEDKLKSAYEHLIIALKALVVELKVKLLLKVNKLGKKLWQ